MDKEQLNPTLSAAENPEQTSTAMTDNSPEANTPEESLLQAAQEAEAPDPANETELNPSAEQVNSGEAAPADPEEPGPGIDQEAQPAPEQIPTGAQPTAAVQTDQRYQNKYAVQHRADLEAMPDGAEKNYLLDRVFRQMKYFSDCSQSNKKKYHVLTILCLIFNGVVPFIMLFDGVKWAAPFVKYVVTALSSAAGILTAIMALKKYRELWVQSRICLEQMKRAVSMYFMRTGEFAGLDKDPEKRKQTLFAVFENIVINEHNQWTELNAKDDKKDNK